MTVRPGEGEGEGESTRLIRPQLLVAQTLILLLIVRQRLMHRPPTCLGRYIANVEGSDCTITSHNSGIHSRRIEKENLVVVNDNY